MAAADSICEVLCVGLVVADHICAPIAAFPPPGELVTTPHLTLAIGGCAANVSVDLARLGVPVGLVGRIGRDVLGEFVRQEMESCGVSCRHLSVSDTAQTAATLVVNVRSEDRRFIHAVGANAELSGREVVDAALTAARVLYVGGFGLNPALSGENVAALFARARAAGVTTVLDVVLDDPLVAMEMASRALPWTDVFLPNVDEARLMTGLRDPLEQSACFLDAGARTVVVTQGSGGALLRDREAGLRRMPGHPVPQIDGTGGGDAFAAGFIYGLLQGRPVEDCLAYGAALGASCVQAAGATTGVFNARQLADFLETHPLRCERLEAPG